MEAGKSWEVKSWEVPTWKLGMELSNLAQQTACFTLVVLVVSLAFEEPSIVVHALPASP